jgi:hypothetical protein
VDANNWPLAASPYIICGRIRAIQTPVVASTWSRVKVLYRCEQVVVEYDLLRSLTSQYLRNCT